MTFSEVNQAEIVAEVRSRAGEALAAAKAINTLLAQAAVPPGPRSLHDIHAEVRQIRCEGCWALPGRDCLPGRLHLGRYTAARAAGLISEAEMAAVLEAIPGAFTGSTLIRDGIR